MVSEETTIQGMSPAVWFELVTSGMKRAVAEEVARLKREGYPLVIWRDGKVVLLQTKRSKAKRTLRKRGIARSQARSASRAAKPARRGRRK